MRTLRTLAAAAALVPSAIAATSAVPETTYEDLVAGRDIYESIYGGYNTFEFDEWRLHLGLAPGLDRVRLRGDFNAAPYPGPRLVESDRVRNDPALPPRLGISWVLGDFVLPDRGWFYTVGLEYTQRDFVILYDNGADSPQLRSDAVALRMGYGFAWYLATHLRYELEAYAAPSLVWSEVDTPDPSTLAPVKPTGTGFGIDGGIRQALVVHPQGGQSWHLGLALDYEVGYARTTFDTSGPGGVIALTSEYMYNGFGYSAFFGHRF